MKRNLIVFATLLFVVAVWYGESRKFYCLDNGRCITIWKTYNNVCFIVPGKYYGIVKPSGNYIESSNTNLLTIYFSKEMPRSLIIQCEQELKINNEKTDAFTFYRYETDTGRFNSLLYFSSAKKRSDMKSGAGLMYIDIHENYALDKYGKKL
jgi:hypothetical protein